MKSFKHNKNNVANSLHLLRGVSFGVTL